MDKSLSELSIQELKILESELEDKISLNNLRQLTSKTKINSLYGAFANQWFRFYDARMAEGITLTGQMIIQTVQTHVNNYLNSVLGGTNDYIIGADTDSNFLNLGPLIEKFYPGREEADLVGIVDNICKKKIQPVYKEACEGIAKYMNLDGSKISFKRESITSYSFFSDMKKRYAMAVWDNEGVRYTKPEIKIVGFECVRSDVPQFFRTIIEETINQLLLVRSEKGIQKFVSDKKDEFLKLTPEDVAEPTGVNNLMKYSSNTTIYTKGCPIHVRASLLHNHHIAKKGLADSIPEISEGNKIKYVKLKTPNPIRENVIGFQGKLPPELGLHKYVDYDVVWDAGLIKPITRILDIFGWTPEERSTLDFI